MGTTSRDKFILNNKDKSACRVLYTDELLTPIINPVVINNMRKAFVSIPMQNKIRDCIMFNAKMLIIQDVIHKTEIRELDHWGH